MSTPSKCHCYTDNNIILQRVQTPGTCMLVYRLLFFSDRPIQWNEAIKYWPRIKSTHGTFRKRSDVHTHIPVCTVLWSIILFLLIHMQRTRPCTHTEQLNFLYYSRLLADAWIVIVCLSVCVSVADDYIVIVSLVSLVNRYIVIVCLSCLPSWWVLPLSLSRDPQNEGCIVIVSLISLADWDIVTVCVFVFLSWWMRCNWLSVSFVFLVDRYIVTVRLHLLVSLADECIVTVCLSISFVSFADGRIVTVYPSVSFIFLGDECIITVCLYIFTLCLYLSSP